MRGCVDEFEFFHQELLFTDHTRTDLVAAAKADDDVDDDNDDDDDDKT